MKHEKQYTPELHEHVEAWHHHTADEGEPQEEHAGSVNTRALGMVFGAIVVFFVVTAAATIVYFIRYTTNLRQERIETHAWATEFSAWNADHQSKLKQYGWADAVAGKVQVPIDMAVARVVDKYKK